MQRKSSTGRRFTPNTYRLDGGDAYLILPTKDGTLTETVIDIGDLDRALAFGRWHRVWSKYTRSYYALCVQEGGQGLHRLVTAAPKGMDVDHDDHDTLNNRRSNLIVCSRSENLCNHAAPRSSRSGVPYVHWHARSQKWVVSIARGGKQHYFGMFATIADAEQAAIVGKAKVLADATT